MRAPRDLDDALRLASLTAHRVAKGTMTPDEAKATILALREFRALLKDRDADAKLAEARRLVADLKAARGG